MHPLLIAAATLFALPSAHAQYLADSVADFSSTQGYKGWYYGYYPASNLSPSGFTQMTAFFFNGWHRAEGGGNAYWTSVDAKYLHPNGAVSSRTNETNWAVRRWVVPPGVSGQFRIFGTATLRNSSNDGVIARTFINGSQVWSAPLNYTARWARPSCSTHA